MIPPRPWAAVLVFLLLGVRAFGAAWEVPPLECERFTLSNGLRVLVHTDRKAPIVAVNVWYHVGSKNEPPGRTGLAHLFEHLMFNGSEHFKDDYQKALEGLGSVDTNGSTDQDRTNYVQVVPSSALDAVLWMESDRMGYLLGALDQARLDEQRGVVQNEKRQGDDEPYGATYEALPRGTYPPNHPYAWTPIGSMEDLQAVTLEDAKTWFRSYYGPNNAVLVLAGDIDLAEARRKVERYFGDLPAGPPVARSGAWAAPMVGERRQILQDRVPQAQLQLVWNTPELIHSDQPYLTLLAGVLGGGPSSRLHRRLVERERLATEASAQLIQLEIAGQFVVKVLARPGGDLARIETIVREEVRRLLEGGPRPEELARVQMGCYASYLRGLERVGGFDGKSDLLAWGEVLTGDPDFARKNLQRRLTAKPEALGRAGRAWLRQGAFALEVRPFLDAAPAAPREDRGRMPAAGPAPGLVFPKIRRATLANGLRVLLVERPGAHTVQVKLVLEGGSASESELPGSASFLLRMLEEGTLRRSARAFREAAEALGASFGAGCGTTEFQLSVSALKAHLPRSLDLLAERALHPAFPPGTLERVREERLALIAQERVDPEALLLRVGSIHLYGSSHPYRGSGTGEASSIQALKVEHLKSLHRTWFRPESAALLVAGDTTLESFLPLAQRAFGAWPEGKAPTWKLPDLPSRPVAGILLVDRPGSAQTAMRFMTVVPERTLEGEVAAQALVEVLGGLFNSRLNLNLREDKHWSYGAGAALADSKGVRTFLAGASVQADRSAEALREIDAELAGIRGERPVTEKELSFLKENLIRSLPGSFETSDSLTSALAEVLAWNLPDDHFPTLPARIRALTPEDLLREARRLIPAQGRLYVVVGDRARIEAPLRALGLGPVQVVDGDGAPMP